ncbi:IclR family transcriptional regulator [Brucella inopinata]|uniref:IclR family transcriptional regulator n=1 Tax=Brucella inopinata TaxID=1218315 RepID=A0AAW7B5K8_9HYPH|nr:IclR family transcriptional regulator [Brucella inopinata]EFM56774.1 Bacterial regulatory protein, IclR family [Brucella inopinata BO1]MDL2331851.1 IclR family transcriptional regulator [Brucella inopinata]
MDGDKTMIDAEGSLKLVPAVMRAAQILDQIARATQEGGKRSGEGMKLSELARQTALPKSSVHGLCQTLVHLKLLKLNGDGSFSMGPQSVRWANVFLAQSDIVEAFHEAVAEAAGLGAYTLTLSHLEGPEVIYLSCRNSSAPLGITFRIGMRVPAVFTATGKAMLAAMSPRELTQHLPSEWPDPVTPTSVSSLTALEKEMAEAVIKGYSLDNGQLREGMFCIGAAICDRPFHPVAGIALSMMAAEARPDIIEAMGKRVRALADNVAERMGWVAA